MVTSPEQQAAFDRHLTARFNPPLFGTFRCQKGGRARAITPGDKKEVIATLRRELSEEGRVPLPIGSVKVDPRHPIVKAALEERSASGQVISQKTNDSLSDRMQALSVKAKIAVMIGMFMLPILLIVVAKSWRGHTEIVKTHPKEEE